MNFKLATLIINFWDGHVSYLEATKGFTKSQLDEMEDAIRNYPLVYGKKAPYSVPFIDDIVKCDLVDFTDSFSNGVLLIQVMINKID